MYGVNNASKKYVKVTKIRKRAKEIAKITKTIHDKIVIFPK
jgi:hypothetical protein